MIPYKEQLKNNNLSHYLNTDKEENNMKRTELPKLDVTKYVGTKTRIEVAEVREAKFGTILFVETSAIPFKDGDSLPDGRTLKASIMLGFSKEGDELTVGIDSKLDKFLKAKGVNVEGIPDSISIGDSVVALIGTEVIAQKNQGGFLEIA